MRKKIVIIYISLLILIAVMVSITYFSYAFLINEKEFHGKINMVTGTLDYKIESPDLTDNSITLEPSDAKEIELTITSLNPIETKYSLYTNNVSDVDIRYTDELDAATGTISSNGEKTVKVALENNSNENKTVTFGVKGGYTNDDIILENSKIAVVLGEGLCTPGKVYEFDYTGDVQEFTAKCSGTYKLEVWGASGDSYNSTYRGGYGSYSVGILNAQSNSNYYVVVGGSGNSYNGGYNGGGESQNHSSDHCFGGGGATHIATIQGQLKDLESYKGMLIDNSYYVSDDIIIVAGAGGGACQYNNSTAGDGGGFEGKSVTSSRSDGYSIQGTQTAGGTSTNWYNESDLKYNGGFGRGALGAGYSGGGGSGFYGGGISYSSTSVSGAGGSGYIASSKLLSLNNDIKAMYCYGCTESSNTNIFTVSTIGSSNYRDTTNCPNGYDSNPISKCAKSGNGYARITYIDGNLEPPVITGGTGTGTWNSTVPVITIATAGKASSGVKNYEYYTSTSSTAPTDSTEATGTLSSPYSLEITAKGTTYVYYRTVSNTDIKSSWSSPEVVNLDIKLIPDYGTSIPSSISTLYYTNDGTNYKSTSTGGTQNGNCSLSISNASITSIGNAPNGTGRYPIVVSGTNTFTLTGGVTNNWIEFSFYAAGGTKTETYIGSIKLIFNDGKSYTIQQAVNNGYIEPLVLYNSDGTTWANMSNTLTGGNTTSVQYPYAKYSLKVKNKSALKQISFYTNTNWNTTYDGFRINKFNNDFDISLSPFTVQYKY